MPSWNGQDYNSAQLEHVHCKLEKTPSPTKTDPIPNLIHEKSGMGLRIF